jgi:hypothetical protein
MTTASNAMMTTATMMTISRPVFTAAPLGNMDAPRQPWLCLPRRFADYRKR